MNALSPGLSGAAAREKGDRSGRDFWVAALSSNKESFAAVPLPDDEGDGAREEA